MSAQQPRVLVVEDEESLHALLQYNLEKEGFSVDVAVDGDPLVFGGVLQFGGQRHLSSSFSSRTARW